MNLGLIHSILLVLGLLVLVKSIWGLGWPASTKSAGIWWSKAALHVNTLFGCVCILLGVALWIAVLIRQPIANLLVALFGILVAWIGTVYFRIDDFQRFIKAVALNRSLTAIRVISLISGAVAVLFIVIALKGL